MALWPTAPLAYGPSGLWPLLYGHNPFAPLPPARLAPPRRVASQVLKYHVLGQQVLSKDIKPGTVDTLDTGSKLTLARSPFFFSPTHRSMPTASANGVR